MSDTHNIDIPAQMIEAAAKVLNDADLEWDEWTEEDREENRREASKALAAAFAECEVREEWGFRSLWSQAPERGPEDWPAPPGGDRDSWSPTREFAEDSVASAARVPRKLRHRLILTLPAEDAVVVTPAQVSQPTCVHCRGPIAWKTARHSHWTHIGAWQGKRCPNGLTGAVPPPVVVTPAQEGSNG